MRIILTETSSNRWGQYSPNLGLLYLASYVRAKLPNMDICYIPPRYGIDYHIKAIKELNPSLYGISITSNAAPAAYKTISRLKDKFPKLKVICGGPHPTATPHDVLEKTGADLCVIGEGELTFADLVKKESEFPEALRTIPGIAYMNGGEFRLTQPRALIENIDEIPFPARDLVSDRDFIGEPLHRGKPTAEMLVSRGCPYRCVFCSNPVFRSGRPALRVRSPRAIADEAEMLYKMGYKEIFLFSDELNCAHDWAVEVCEALANLGHSDLFFQCQLRPDKISVDLARSLREMNCWLVRLGIESANQRVLDGIKKKLSIDQIENACSLLSKHGVKVFGFLMMFQIWESNGQLEHETPDEVVNTLNITERLYNRKQLHYMSWSLATPMHGSEMYDIVTRHGLCDSNYYPCEPWDVSTVLPNVSMKQLSRLRRKGMLLQAKMALKGGSIGWANWRRLLHKGINMVIGKRALRWM